MNPIFYLFGTCAVIGLLIKEWSQQVETSKDPPQVKVELFNFSPDNPTPNEPRVLYGPLSTSMAQIREHLGI
jgi:hypothetical protein